MDDRLLTDEELIAVEERIQDDLNRREKIGKTFTATERIEATIRATAKAQLAKDQKFEQARLERIKKKLWFYRQNMGGRDAAETSMWVMISERDLQKLWEQEGL